jgi:hypothetical protein
VGCRRRSFGEPWNPYLQEKVAIVIIKLIHSRYRQALLGNAMFLLGIATAFAAPCILGWQILFWLRNGFWNPDLINQSDPSLIPAWLGGGKILDWSSIPPFSLLLLIIGGLFVWIGYDLKNGCAKENH